MFVDTQVENFLVTVYTYLNANFEMDVAVRNTITDLNLGVEVEILQGRVIDNSRSYFQFFTYLMLTAIMMGISPIFFTFNQKDVAKRNDCSSTTLLNRNMQLTLGCGIAAIAMWAVSFIPLFFMHQEEVFTIVTLYRVINTLALLAVSVGIAFLVGNLLNNRDALTGASTIIAMGLCFLSGVFVPQEFLGEGVLMVARFLPTYWYIRGNNVLSGVLEVTGETGRIFWEGFFIQFGFAIALFAVTLMFIRQKKLKAVV
jgi:ABC-2 type transport system permease protein